MVKKGLLYSESHEWVRVDGQQALIGITDHAQEELGAIVFIELPSVGTDFAKGDNFGAIESVKAASDLYLPVSGKVVEANTDLEDNPEAINEDAYKNWIVRIELKDPAELDELLSPEDYEKTL
ncbi:MAG: glycine cleavage system protein GcvH [Acholeplasmataceae bacterium]